MKQHPAVFAPALLALMVVSQASAADWTRLERLQKSPIAFGARAELGYTLGTKDSIDYGLSAELLFPLISTARARVQVLRLTILAGNQNVLSFNSDLALDALVAFPLRRMRIYPYVYAGAGFVTDQQTLRYSLRGGVGVEGRVARFSRAFGELGISHEYPGTHKTQVRGAAGARFGA